MPRGADRNMGMNLLSEPVLESEKRKDLEHWVESVRTESTSSASVSHVDIHVAEVTSHGLLTKPKLMVEHAPAKVKSPDSNAGYSDDFEPEERKPVAADKETKSVRVYRRSCRKLGIVPLRKVLCQFGGMDLCYRDFCLSRRELKALCMALLYEKHAWHVDVSGNRIGRKEWEYLQCVLEKRPNVSVLNISNNELSGQGLRQLADYMRRCDSISDIDISGNKITDKEGNYIADIIQENKTLRRLCLSHNELREVGGKIIGAALVNNTRLEELDLSWNHLRHKGAISIAKGLETNQHLRIVNLAWNGFGFEGSVALGDMLTKNSTITSLDVSSNRISSAALLEIIRGLSKNRTLTALRIGQNPITASFTNVLLESVQKHPHLPLQYLDLAGIVVDKQFESILEKLRESRFLEVTYDVALPISKRTPEEMMNELKKPQTYNIDPLRMLYLLKEKMRARDFFEKINKDKNDGLDRDELFQLFKEAGLPCTGSVVDRIMEFMDTNGDGTIDLAEFLVGDKKIKKYSREQFRAAMAHQEENYSKYSRSFRKATIDPLTLTVKVEDASKQLPSPNTLNLPTPGGPASRRGSISRRASEDIRGQNRLLVNTDIQ